MLEVAQSLAPSTPGAELYETVCVKCHGPDGRGRALLPPFPAGSEERFYRAVLEGNPRAGMPPFRGQLTEDELRSLLAYVRTFARAAPTGADGRQLYAVLCAPCHGADAAGTRLGPRLRGLALGPAQFAAVVREGRPGTTMTPFGRTLAPPQIAAIHAWLRSLGP